MDLERLRQEQLEEPELKIIIEFKESGVKPDWSAISKFSPNVKYH